ncbi:MAG TPA: hypothetical protein VIM16_19820 [Mucilaginibacter sp.]
MQIRNVFDRIIKNCQLAYDWLERSFLSDEYKTAYKTLMDKRYAILE